MEGGARFTPVRTGLTALAALFVFGAQDASAQARDTRPYIERQGFREYQDTGERRLFPLPVGNSSFTVDTNVFISRAEEPARITNRPGTEEEDGEETIVVTGIRNDITVSPHPDFERNIFDDLGMTTNHNPDNEGLELFPIRRDDIEGWRGVDVEIIDIPGPFSLEAQIKRGAGIELTYQFGVN